MNAESNSSKELNSNPNFKFHYNKLINNIQKEEN